MCVQRDCVWCGAAHTPWEAGRLSHRLFLVGPTTQERTRMSKNSDGEVFMLFLLLLC